MEVKVILGAEDDRAIGSNFMTLENLGQLPRQKSHLRVLHLLASRPIDLNRPKRRLIKTKIIRNRSLLTHCSHFFKILFKKCLGNYVQLQKSHHKHTRFPNVDVW